jgi:hypothetical protein
MSKALVTKDPGAKGTEQPLRIERLRTKQLRLFAAWTYRSLSSPCLCAFVLRLAGFLITSQPRLRSREASPPSLGRSRTVSPISRMNCIARFLRLKPRFQSVPRRRNGSFVPQSVSPQPFVFNDIGSFVPSKNYPPPQSHVCSKSTTRERPGRTSSMAVCTPVALHLASRLFSIT